MTVSPCSAKFFISNQELYQFLEKKQAYCIKNNCTQIASIAVYIDSVDPLVVFQKLATIDRLNFYWESPSKKQAIAAIGAVTKFEVEGKSRFSEAENFIKFNLSRIINFCNVNNSLSVATAKGFSANHSLFCL